MYDLLHKTCHFASMHMGDDDHLLLDNIILAQHVLSGSHDSGGSTQRFDGQIMCSMLASGNDIVATLPEC